MRLAKAGYYNGDPAQVGAACVEDVLSVAEYESFLGTYERTWHRLNSNKE